MRFVVLRYGGTSTHPAHGRDLLDELTTGGSRGTRPDRQPADPGPATTGPGSASAAPGTAPPEPGTAPVRPASASPGPVDPTGLGPVAEGPSPTPPGPAADADDEDVAAALAAVLAPPRAPRDDLAALAAVLGVTTVLDEALGSPDVATTVRSRAEGLTLTDGPAATPDGPLVGLHVLDAPDLDALVDVLTLLPAGTFEVHPVVAA